MAIEALLEERGIQNTGHFVLAAGEHSSAYLRKDLILTDPQLVADVADEMGTAIVNEFDSDEIDAVVGIAPCSAILANHVGLFLSEVWDKPIVTVFSEKIPQIIEDDEGEPKLIEPLGFKRGYDREIEDKKGIVVEDIVTTAKTLKEFVALLRNIKGFELQGATCVVNRKPETVTEESLGLGKWLPLVARPVPSWPPDECVLCEDLEANPINTDLGHGAKFLAERDKTQ